MFRANDVEFPLRGIAVIRTVVFHTMESKNIDMSGTTGFSNEGRAFPTATSLTDIKSRRNFSM